MGREAVLDRPASYTLNVRQPYPVKLVEITIVTRSIYFESKSLRQRGGIRDWVRKGLGREGLEDDGRWGLGGITRLDWS